MTKRFLSMILAIVMVISLFTGLTITASAAGYAKTTALAVGDVVVLASDTAKMELTSISTTNTKYGIGTAYATEPAGTWTWTVEAGDSEGTFAFKNADGKYLYWTSGNSLNVNATLSAKTSWTVSFDDAGNAIILNASDSARQILWNKSSPRFACYTGKANDANYYAVQLYKLDESVTVCEHANATSEQTTDPTCTEAGVTTWTCPDCEATWTTNEPAALGHQYNDVTTEPTCGATGLTVSTCSVCGDVKETVIPATGDHNFVNGICDVCGAEDIDYSGSYYIAGIRSKETTYQYITGAMNGTRYALTDSGLAELPTEITAPAAAETFVFEKNEDGTYSIYAAGIAEDAKYFGWTDGNSGAFVTAEEALKVTITALESGLYNISFYSEADSQDRFLSLNTSSTNLYAAWYKSGQIKDLALIPVTGEAHTHTYVETTVPSTCTEAGSITYTCSGCDDTYTEPLPLAEHDYDADGICAECGAEKPEGFALATQLNEGDQLVIYYPTKSLVMGSEVDSNSRVIGITAEAPVENILTLPEGAVVFTVSYRDDTNFVLVTADGKYLTSGATGNSLTYAEAEDACSQWNLVAKEGTDLFYIYNSGANYNGNYNQALEIYSSAFTTYGWKANNYYEFQLYTMPGETPECVHEWTEWAEVTAPTCTTDGAQSRSCTLCGETQTTVLPATGHTFTMGETGVACSCGTALELSDIATAKAYTDDNTYYWFKGIVTYVNDKALYIEDATGGVCVYFTSAEAIADVALGDEIHVWDTMTTYKGLVETTYTTADQYVKTTTGNALPNTTVTLAELLADTTNLYQGQRVTITGLKMGTIVTGGSTMLADAEGNEIALYKAAGMAENVTAGDTVTVTAIVSCFNNIQLLVNPGTIANDVVVTEEFDEGEVEAKDYSGTYYIAAKRSTGNYWYMTSNLDTKPRYLAVDTGLTALPESIASGEMDKTFVLTKNEDGTYTLQAYGNENSYVGWTSGNYAQFVTAEEARNLTVTENLDGTLIFTFPASETETRYLSLNSSTGNNYFAFYTGSQTHNLSLIPVEAVAQPEPETMTIYFQNNWLWTDISLYAWDTAGEFIGEAWPGTKMEYHGNDGTYDVYKLTIPANIGGLIINGVKNDGSGALDKTPDIVEGWYDGICYYMLWNDGNAVGSEHIDVIIPPQTECQHLNQTTTTVEATCTEDGSVTVTCEDCGEVISTEVIPATGHSYTYTDNGENHTVGCSKCDYSATEDHTYVDGSCICGAVEGPIPASDLKFINKSLSLQSYIAFNVLASKSALSKYESWYVVFERYDYEKNEVVTQTVEGTVYMNNYWQFEYKLNSYHMSDTVTATLYGVKEGKTYVGETYVNSAADYVIASLPKATSDAHRKVFADLLTYGAKAQIYMGYNVEKLADADLGEYASFVTTTDPTAESIFAQTDKGLTGVTLGRMALGIASSVELQAILKVSSGYVAEDLYAEMAYVSGGKTMTQRIEGENFQVVGGGFYVAVFNALTATDGRTPVEITVYDAAGNAVSETWTYSIASYLDGTKLTGNALNTLYALINFYDSAAVYYNG